MTTVAQIPPGEQSPVEALNYQGAELPNGVSELRGIVDAQVAEFGEGRHGTFVEETKGLQSSLDTVEARVGEGDLVAGQVALEQAPRPRKLNEVVRGTLVELHQAERGEPTSDQRFRAVTNLEIDVAKEISALTDPKKGNLQYTDPEVQTRSAVAAAFRERHHNYLEDETPESVLLGTDEERTPHQVAEDAYEALLSYAEDRLRDPNITPEKAEELRTARDTLYLERKVWKEQFDAQNEVLHTVMRMVGSDNEQFSEAKLRAAIRESIGDQIPRLQEIVEVAQQTADPIERFNLLNDIQNQRSPIKSVEAFEAWKQKRADKMKVVEEQESAERANNARKTIETIQGGNEARVVQPDTTEQLASKEAEIAPIPTGWTELVHGTSSDRWQQTGDRVTVTGGGLSAISLEDIARGAGKTTESYARTRAADGEPIEVRVSFYREDLSPRRGVQPDAAELKAGLSQDTLRLISRYHQDRHPLIPSGETLLKIGQAIDPESGRQVEHYVPESVATDYIEAVKRETGKDIPLPSVTPAAEQVVQQQAESPQVIARASAEMLGARTAPQERQPNPNEQFIKATLARVPREVVLENLAAISRDKVANGEQVTIKALDQTLSQRLSEKLSMDTTQLDTLAKRIQQNGFYESGGGIWRIQAGPNTPQGQVATDARKLVREIISNILR